jgi:site-specific DNA recombinase
MLRGEWGLRGLADEVEQRGFTQRARRKRPERVLPAGRLHALLQNRYYLGTVTYQGIEYEGKHPPLVTPEVFEAVQAVLDSHRQGGERAYRHTHYLKGTLRCGRCHCRLGYRVSRGNGGVYAYYFCLGRHERRTEDVTSLDKRSDLERRTLTTELYNLRQERYRWADEAMSGAVPDDIASEKQASLGKRIIRSQARLDALQVAAVDVQATVEACLELAQHCAVAYQLASPRGGREWDQAWWNWLEVGFEAAEMPPVIRQAELTPLVEAIMRNEAVKP